MVQNLHAHMLFDHRLGHSREYKLDIALIQVTEQGDLNSKGSILSPN
jgi:hypothetical protein